MAVEDQGEVIRFLSRPDAYGAGAVTVERVETHISIVFLVGGRAFKLKRIRRFPYLDFTTRERRRAACEAEVDVNRRTAPGLYRGVVAVVRTPDGGLRLGGGGEPVEWLVEMTRFDQEALFDRLARRGRLDRHVMVATAEAIARFHEGAAERRAFGGHDGVAAIIESNAQCLADAADGVFDGRTIERLNESSRRILGECGAYLDQRRRAGKVRHCHGDLHLRNVVLVDGRPTLFDAIEFNESIAHIDVIYDLAFLLMDLEYRGLRGLANVALNRYLDITADNGGLRALPLFLSMRAAIRAHVAAAGTGVSDPAQAATFEEARGYLKMARTYLVPPPPRLVAIGGLSGSGKSRTAREVAPFLGASPGARMARSDVIRKRSAGVEALTRLGPEGYSPEMTERTYRTLTAEVRAALASGHSVIADAVFARPEQRRAVAAVAVEVGVPFDALWLEAPADVMAHRVTVRRGNVSDATAEVLERQLSYDLGDVGWTRLDTTGPRERTVAKARSLLGL